MKRLFSFFLAWLMAMTMTLAPTITLADEARTFTKSEKEDFIKRFDEANKSTLIPEGTCYADYRKLRRATAIKALLAPGIGFGVIYGLGYAGGAWGASAGTGWDALAGAIVGIVLGIYVGFGWYVTYQTTQIVRLMKVHNYIKLLEQAYEGKGKKLSKMAEKLNTTIDVVSQKIIEANETGILCDGSLRGQSRNSKLKRRLARKKDIARYIKEQL